jgi:hypothetical protein
MKEYVEAELEVIEFDEEDVIISSCQADCDAETPGICIHNH